MLITLLLYSRWLSRIDQELACLDKPANFSITEVGSLGQLMDGFSTASTALKSIHDFVATELSDEASAPLDALLETLRGAVLQPSAEATPHEGARRAFAALLFSGHTPRDLCQWLHATDHTAAKDVTAGRKKVQ